jgi:hypothetical protein
MPPNRSNESTKPTYLLRNKFSGIGKYFIIGAVRNQFGSSSAQHQSLALTSVHALDELQIADADSAKSFLARQVAYYYRSIEQFDWPSPQKQELLHHIQASSVTSPEFKECSQHGNSVRRSQFRPNQTLQPTGGCCDVWLLHDFNIHVRSKARFRQRRLSSSR